MIYDVYVWAMMVAIISLRALCVLCLSCASLTTRAVLALGYERAVLTLEHVHCLICVYVKYRLCLVLSALHFVTD